MLLSITGTVHFAILMGNWHAGTHPGNLETLQKSKILANTLDLFALLVSSCCVCYHAPCCKVDDGNRLATNCSKSQVVTRLLSSPC